MPKLHKENTSIELREENLVFKDRALWIKALKKSPRSKLIFRQCTFEAFPLSRLLLELGKYEAYEAIEFIDCSVVSTDINSSMQLLLAKIANMPKQNHSIKFTVIDTKHSYDLKTLPLDPLIDSLEHRNSSLLLDIKDLERNPFHLEISRDDSSGLRGKKESSKELVISSFDSASLLALIGEKEKAKEFVVPLFDNASLVVSFTDEEEKLIVKQAKSFKEIEDSDAIEKSALINSRIIFDYLIEIAKFAKSQNLSLEINTKLDSINEFSYTYDAKSNVGNCNVSLHCNYCGGKSLQEAIVADNLPKLLSSLPTVTSLELFNLNSRLLNGVEFADSLSTPAFEELKTMEIIGNAETQESKTRFFASLKELEHLQELELLGQVLFETDMADIAYLLIRKKKLQKVTLQGANLTDGALECLARELDKQVKQLSSEKTKEIRQRKLEEKKQTKQAKKSKGKKQTKQAKKSAKDKHPKQLKKLDLSNNSRPDEFGYTRKGLKNFLKILELLRPQEVRHDFGPNEEIDALLRPQTEKEEPSFSTKEEFSDRETTESTYSIKEEFSEKEKEEELTYGMEKELFDEITEETSNTEKEEHLEKLSFDHPVFGSHLMRVTSTDTESLTTGDESGYTPRTETTGDESGYTPRADSDHEDEPFSAVPTRESQIYAVTVRESGSQIRRAGIAINRPKINVEEEKNRVGGGSGIVPRSQIITTNRYRWNSGVSHSTEEEGAKDGNSFTKN
ncbi:hypothetical protein Lnau_2521 [Legionella nautarum]|uniref:Uncharacterized protein n=1 Tax=Legionella nautarum TaxID=45070 RepID=A0A0W0WKM0_9GAMM|nr:hypothetical protein [Legionella nautarum]KTD32873.1 hypothetical protein Lnau_2521 [Legionella nautarum]